MAGAKAVMAVTPHIEVPAVSNSDMCGGRPANWAARGIKKSPAPTALATTGMLLVPVAKTSMKLNLAATHTIPPCSTALEAVVRPGLNVASGTPTVFLMAMPSKMETGMPDSGTPKPADNVEAAVNPAVATAAERPRPGSIDGCTGLSATGSFLVGALSSSFLSSSFGLGA